MNTLKNFINLHTHTYYSFFNSGTEKSISLIRKAKKLNMPALAITDTWNMKNVLNFYYEAKYYGIKPIIGCEIYVKNNYLSTNFYKLVLLAKNNQGYKNILKITSNITFEMIRNNSPYTIDIEILKKYSKDIIAFSNCLENKNPYEYIEETLKKIDKIIKKFQDIFQDNFYLELQSNLSTNINQFLFNKGKRLNIPIVGTNEVFFLEKEDFEVYKVLTGIKTNKTLKEINYLEYFEKFKECYLKNLNIISDDFFKTHQEALLNTEKIASVCNVIFENKKQHIPKLKLSKGFDAYSFLEKKVWEGIEKRYSKTTKEIKERVEEELKITKAKNLSNYFLILWNIIKIFKEKNIYINTSGGGINGSIILYALGITETDPVKYNLIFEIFSNNNTLDIEIEKEKCEEFIKYIKQTYKNKFAFIGSINSLEPRNLIRRLGKFLEVPDSEIDKIAKLVHIKEISFKEAYNTKSELQNKINSSKKNKKLYKLACKIEHLPFEVSNNKESFVIADISINNYIQTIKDKYKNKITLFNQCYIAKQGFLIIDLFKSKYLQVIRDIISEIEKMEGIKIDINTIPLNDEKTFKLLKDGNTENLFLLENIFVKSFFMLLKSININDIFAGILLSKHELINKKIMEIYIDRKNCEKQINYIHPKLKSILEETYGVLLYREQILKIINIFTGVSLTEADNILKDITNNEDKLIKKEINRLFIAGIKNGFSKKEAQKIINFISFSGKHTSSKYNTITRGLIAYKLAYLKANYPEEFTYVVKNLNVDDYYVIEKYV